MNLDAVSKPKTRTKNLAATRAKPAKEGYALALLFRRKNAIEKKRKELRELEQAYKTGLEIAIADGIFEQGAYRIKEQWKNTRKVDTAAFLLEYGANALAEIATVTLKAAQSYVGSDLPNNIITQERTTRYTVVSKQKPRRTGGTKRDDKGT